MHVFSFMPHKFIPISRPKINIRILILSQNNYSLVFFLYFKIFVTL